MVSAASRTYKEKKKVMMIGARVNPVTLFVILFSRTFEGEQPLDTGGGRVFSVDATLGLLATRWRL